jgi:hypothetical protein
MDDMHALNRPPDDLALSSLADQQHGIVDYADLVGLGLGRGAIKHRAHVGRLHRLYRGVYAVGRRNVSREGHWLAAVRACGPNALLSHRSAAALWGVLRDSRAAIDVTVLGCARRGSGGITVHRARRLEPDDRVCRDHIPATSLARTLLDLAAVAPTRQLARAIDEAERLRLFDLRAIDELLERSNGRRGVRALRQAIDRYRAGAPVTRSELERRFFRLCDDAGIPRPAMNLFVAGYEVDAAWLEHRLVVEVDSFEFHRTRAAFEATAAATPRSNARGSASFV